MHRRRRSCQASFACSLELAVANCLGAAGLATIMALTQCLRVLCCFVATCCTLVRTAAPTELWVSVRATGTLWGLVALRIIVPSDSAHCLAVLCGRGRVFKVCHTIASVLLFSGAVVNHSSLLHLRCVRGHLSDAPGALDGGFWRAVSCALPVAFFRACAMFLTLFAPLYKLDMRLIAFHAA